jgi:hypothetical protein
MATVLGLLCAVTRLKSLILDCQQNSSDQESGGKPNHYEYGELEAPVVSVKIANRWRRYS